MQVFSRSLRSRSCCSPLVSSSLATRSQLVLTAALRQLSIGNVAAKPEPLKQRNGVDKRTFLSYDLPSLRLICDQGKLCSMLMRSRSTAVRLGPVHGLHLHSSSYMCKPPQAAGRDAGAGGVACRAVTRPLPARGAAGCPAARVEARRGAAHRTSVGGSRGGGPEERANVRAPADKAATQQGGAGEGGMATAISTTLPLRTPSTLHSGVPPQPPRRHPYPQPS